MGIRIPSIPEQTDPLEDTDKLVVSVAAGVTKTTLLSTLADWTLNTYEGFIQSGTGAVARTQHSKNAEIVSVNDFGAVGDGVTDDSAAILDASVYAVSVGGKVIFPSDSYLIGTQIALTTAHNNLEWDLGKTTILKGFSGNLVTLAGTVRFHAHGGVINGQQSSYTGKGFVFSGASHYPRIDCFFLNFPDSAIEFGSDAGFRADCSGSQIRNDTTEVSAITCTGTDTTAMDRMFNNVSTNGKINLTGTLGTTVVGGFNTGVFVDATASITLVGQCSMAASSAITFNGLNTTIVGCRIANSVTLAAAMTGEFIGNVQTTGTFTDSTVAGNCTVIHHPLTASYILVGRARLFLNNSQWAIQTGGISSAGDADVTYLPTAPVPTYRYATALTADRTVTLSTTGASAGMRCGVVRPAGNTGGPWTVTLGSTGVKLRENEWAIAEYTGSFWACIARGTINGNLGNVAADNGDAAATLTPGTSLSTQIWATAITADRAVTLSATGAYNGAKFRIVRAATATGAFNLNVGTGPLKAMGTAGSFCDVEYNGSAWVLTAYGTL